MTRFEAYFFSISALVLGIIFLTIPAEYLSSVYFRIVAVGFIIMGVIKLVFSNKYSIGEFSYRLNMIEGSLACIFGVIFFNFYKNLWVDTVCFIALAIIPVIRLIISKNKLNQIIFDFLKYIGLISIFGGANYLNKIFFYSVGSIWLLVGIYIVVNYYFQLRKARKLNGKEN